MFKKKINKLNNNLNISKILIKMKENSNNIIYLPYQDNFYLQQSLLNNRRDQLLPENEYIQNENKIPNESGYSFLYININQTKQKLRKTKSLKIAKPKKILFDAFPKWRSSNKIKILNVK